MTIPKTARIYVAGHIGLVGGALWQELARRGFTHLIGRPHAQLDLLDQSAVRRFFAEEKPEYVFLAAARVGGIQANFRHPAEFLYENLQIQTNVIHEAHRAGVRKLLYVGSSCVYPKMAPQPIEENSLLTGPLEPTNEWFAVAKIAGIKMCQAYRRQYGGDFIVAMPANLYGPEDDFSSEHSHVLSALIRRFHEAKITQAPSVTCWGTGSPRREFLYVEDAARALILLMESYSEEQPINVGCGSDLAIRDLAALTARVVGYRGEIAWDSSKPDGTPRKLLVSSRIFGLGWRPGVELEQGVRMTYQAFLTRVGTA